LFTRAEGGTPQCAIAHCGSNAADRRNGGFLVIEIEEHRTPVAQCWACFDRVVTG
jgi:hypothetical protein